MPLSPLKPFYLEEIRIEPERNRVERRDRTVSLEKRVMDLLVVLAERPGEVRSREELLDRVWSDREVTEESLTNAVSQLRQGLGDSARSPRFVETIPKRGYRLLAEPRDAPSRRHPSLAPVALGAVFLAPLLGVALYLSDPAPDDSGALSVRPLTSAPGAEFDPAFDPTGRRLAYVAPGSEGDLEIWVREPDNSAPRQLTESPGFDGSPAWSPDGESIAFMHSDDAGPTCEVRVLPVDGGATRRLAGCHAHSESSVAWSPSGDVLVYTDRPEPGAPFRLYRLDPEAGAAPEPLTDPPAESYGDLDPAFSPDGRELAFVRGALPSTLPAYVSPVLGDLWILDLASGAARRVTHDLAEIPGVSWLRDGARLLFASDRLSGRHALWSVGVRGAPARRLLEVDGMVRNPVEGDTGIVFERVRGQLNLYRVDLEGSRSLEPVAVSERSETFPAVAPGGDRLAFVSDRSGWPEIWISRLDGSRASQRTDLRGSATHRPAWSPDGRRIVFAARRAGALRLFVVSASGGPVSPLTEDSDTATQDLAPAWSADGRRILFASNRGGSWQVWSVAAGGGEPRRLTRRGAFAPLVASEGDLFFTRLDVPGIWRRGPSGEEVRVVERHWEKSWANWTVRGGNLYRLERTGWTTGRVERLGLDDGASEALIDIAADHNLSVAGLAVSPDERWLFLAIRDRLDFDLLLAE